MNTGRSGGFAMIVLIILIGLIGLYVTVIAGITATAGSQSRDVLLNARLNTLLQSGLALTRQNPDLTGRQKLSHEDESFKNCFLTIEDINGVKLITARCRVGRTEKTATLKVKANGK